MQPGIMSNFTNFRKINRDFEKTINFNTYVVPRQEKTFLINIIDIMMNAVYKLSILV